jgi:hypothetical protein
MKPKRIQRRRVKGWEMPPNTVSVTRPGKFGNPFKVGGYFAIGVMNMMWCEAAPEFADARFTLIKTPEQAVQMYRQLRKRYPLPDSWKEEIRGRDLACFCSVIAKWCHADVLLEIANELP